MAFLSNSVWVMAVFNWYYWLGAVVTCYNCGRCVVDW